MLRDTEQAGSLGAGASPLRCLLLEGNLQEPSRARVLRACAGSGPGPSAKGQHAAAGAAASRCTAAPQRPTPAPGRGVGVRAGRGRRANFGGVRGSPSRVSVLCGCIEAKRRSAGLLGRLWRARVC